VAVPFIELLGGAGPGDDDRALVGDGTSLPTLLLEGEPPADIEVDDPIDRLGGSGRDEAPKERRCEESRDMAR